MKKHDRSVAGEDMMDQKTDKLVKPGGHEYRGTIYELINQEEKGMLK